jgi:hypothetical protein
LERAAPRQGADAKTRPQRRDRSGLLRRSRREGSQARGQAVDDRIVKSPQEASQGQKPRVTRYVLSIGLVLVVILFIVAYFIGR